MKKFPNKYLQIFACCIPVKGFARSIVVDTQRAEFHYIPNDLFVIIDKELINDLETLYEIYGKENEILLDEYIDFLINKELAFFTDDYTSFPPIEMTWETPRLITNAILDIDASSVYDLEKAIKQIDELGAEALQIRIFSKIELEKLSEIFSCLQFATKRLRTVDILLPFNNYTKSKKFDQVLSSLSLLNEVIIHSSPSNEIKKSISCKTIFTKEKIENSSKCGCIGTQFFSSDLMHITESINHNSCLNKKISIDINGDIKNCPSMKTSYGNFETTNLEDVIGIPAFKEIWEINKSQVSICKDCEYRLICTDCRAYVKNIYDKPFKCNYNPYTTKWEN